MVEGLLSMMARCSPNEQSSLGRSGNPGQATAFMSAAWVP